MNDDTARLLVVGAGVNGSATAAGLHGGHIDVTVLARGGRYAELVEQGIIIENPFNMRRVVAMVPVIDHLEPSDVYDFILVVIRKNQVTDVLPALAQNASPSIVFMGNNLAGPGKFISALGRDRVMMGAVYGAGKRDGNVIRAIVAKSISAPFGEVDGTITPRLIRIVKILRQGGFKAEASREIVDFQATHAVGVALIGKLTLRHGCDTHALAEARDELRLFIEARREAHHVLRALGRRVVPWSEGAMDGVPTFLQVAGFRALLRSRLGEVGLAWHCSQAPDEMRQLAIELEELVDEAGVAVPTIKKVLALN